MDPKDGSTNNYGSFDNPKAKVAPIAPERSKIAKHPADQQTTSDAPQPAIRLRHSIKSNKEISPHPSTNQTNRFSLDPSRAHSQNDPPEADSSSKFVENFSKNTNGPIATLSLPPDQDEPHEAPRKYPTEVLYIVANEFCERFSFYGFRTVLVLYLRSVLGYSDASATVTFHLFVALCYTTPLLGAYIADSIWGRYKTILNLSMVYVFGEIILVLSSIYWNLGNWTEFSTFVGLFFIGVGTGGIKPCVSALGGDQFLPNEESRRRTFFSLFYGAINLGSLISTALTPTLRSQFRCVSRLDCYPLAFAVPCILMIASILLFMRGSSKYVKVPLPEKNVLVAFYQCIWLSLKRRFSQKSSESTSVDHIIPTLIEDNTSSNLSTGNIDENNKTSSLDQGATVIAQIQQISQEQQRAQDLASKETKRDSHWLYLASDRFDKASIEDFRAVLNILLLFAPIPVYWSLFDQQSSLWTLQATRMNGRILGTNFVLQPDQISVLNPLLLIALLPVFELLIYPTLNRYNVLTRPIQRMTAGGMIAALSFVATFFIEVQIQRAMPISAPPAGRSSLLIVNGLADCALVQPSISYVQIPGVETTLSTLNGTMADRAMMMRSRLDQIGSLEALPIEVMTDNSSALNNYQLKFRLASEIDQRLSILNHPSGNISRALGCPFDSQLERDYSIAPLSDESVRMLYLSQANGKLTQNLFNDSLALPEANKARIRLVYEAFGSLARLDDRKFYLTHSSDIDEIDGKTNTSHLQSTQTFKLVGREGQVIVSDYIDVIIPSASEKFYLQFEDGPLHLNQTRVQNVFWLKPGTRNLLVVHQRNSVQADIKLNVLQDNNYRISILYQCIPYFMISFSEIMFSITALELSYTLAPTSMKSVVIAITNVTTAIGNLLTVLIESLHLFNNVAYEFLFYAVLMVLDITVFAIIGYYFKPYKANQS